MKAALALGDGRVEVSEVLDPVAAPGQVVVAVDVCGVCGTDLHVQAGHYPRVNYPVIPGHEFAGRVVELGDGVEHLTEGDRVVVDPMVSCGHCPACRDGRTNLCENGGGLGTTSPGAFAELVAVDATQCVRLPDDLPAAHAALVEPLSCVLHALDRIGPGVGRSTLVIGAGPSGLMMAAVLARGGAQVDVVDRASTRLPEARRFGARRTATSIDELRSSRGWSLIVDVTGASQAIEDALESLAVCGHLHVFGVAPADARVSLAPYEVFARELTITGSTSVLRSFGRALELVVAGAVPVEPLVSSRFALADIAAAFDAVRAGEVLKALVTPAASTSSTVREGVPDASSGL